MHDNQSLTYAQQFDRLVCVYCFDPNIVNDRRYQVTGMGSKRLALTLVALRDLSQQLSTMGQHVHVVFGDLVAQIVELTTQAHIDTFIVSRQFGNYERAQIQHIASVLPHVNLIESDNYTLFNSHDLPWLETELPKQFSPFRHKAEALNIAPCQAEVTQLPQPALAPPEHTELPDWMPIPDAKQAQFKGGERAAMAHLGDYFGSELPNTYKQTRNALTGWGNSSKLSVYLSLGCLSVKRVAHILHAYQHKHGRNDDNQWLLVELLWREFFQWHALNIGKQLYNFQGQAKNAPLTTFYPERFKAWCTGTTPYPIVNAAMKELSATGYISNRARQIVASCLVNELQVDWRYGAAWFQHHLLDYDVAVNWGNWQYIAGVGVDPRGGRHFNLTKQTQLYDPNGDYIAWWGGTASHNTLDQRDMVDWPITS
ncbi:DASH family cryptochrome [Echinimonas agarilytica]|uniref:Cryptochrome DASH n=2 Tax=Echinimonas agarilytica TaxID=1215918 RepID=A0AA41WAP3_9GAMM|nr:DASH family cryptochrome [Echinimonas agarilytica]